MNDDHEDAVTSVKWLWVHVASLGEYEQAMPLILRILREKPDYAIMTTFFSPSGYEHASEEIDRLYHMYLPWDYKSNSKLFLETLKPEAVVFDKYDFWYNFLHSVKNAEIPLYLINAYFKPTHRVFRIPQGSFFDIFTLFTQIFTQDQESAELINARPDGNAVACGDTRINRVLQLSNADKDFPRIKKVTEKHTINIIAGSSWPPDEEILAEFMLENSRNEDIGMVIVPHEISTSHIDKIMETFKAFEPILYSQLTQIKNLPPSKVLIVDKIGILKHIYKYFDYAYIGGGFGAGVHSVAEAAIHAIPLFYGPRIERSFQAEILAEHGYAYIIKRKGELEKAFAQAKANKDTIQAGLSLYIKDQGNALDIIYNQISLTL